MRVFLFCVGIFSAMFSAQAFALPQTDLETLKQQVTDTERAFAKTMADRDHAAFAKFIADDAIFFTGKRALHGSDEVVKAWKPFYDEAAAPFSWTPETVEVLATGKLALSTGPVKDTDGKVVATFTSIWRMDANGAWKIIFDKGNSTCNCATP